MIAALYVLAKGPYQGLDHVDAWDLARDAKRYTGPHPVVAHPPCARWGRYWFGGPSAKKRLEKGDDDGCFEHALKMVRTYGGVLEHPEASHAWSHFGLVTPPKSGGWVSAGMWDKGWTCCVEQGHYGHRARKATWLYAVGVELPSLIWGASESRVRLDAGFHSAEERRRWDGNRWRHPEPWDRMGKRAREETPIAFRDVLIAMAESVNGGGI